FAARPSHLVVAHGFTQDGHLFIGEMKERSFERLGEVRGTRTVAPVAAIVLTATVVQEGKELDDQPIGPGVRRYTEPVLAHPPPMSNAVNAVQAHGKPMLGSSDNLFNVRLTGSVNSHLLQ